MIATVGINNLRLRAIVGVTAEERKKRQELIVNIRADYDISNAISADDISTAVDYSPVAKSIAEKVEGTSFNLVETLAASVLGMVMADERILHATVRVDKPTALRFADSAYVELCQSRNT